jgi:hypothetical protein
MVAARLPALVPALETERLLEQAGALLGVVSERAHAVEALQRELARDLGVIRRERLVPTRVHAQLVLEPLGIGEQEPVALAADLHALRPEPRGPELDRLRRGDPPDDAVDHPRAGAAGSGAGVLEEGQVEAGVALLVAVEEVVDGRVVLVDGLLDEAQAKHPRVEVDVAGRVSGDRGDVVDAVELHGRPLRRFRGGYPFVEA